MVSWPYNTTSVLTGRANVILYKKLNQVKAIFSKDYPIPSTSSSCSLSRPIGGNKTFLLWRELSEITFTSWYESKEIPQFTIQLGTKHFPHLINYFSINKLSSNQKIVIRLTSFYSSEQLGITIYAADCCMIAADCCMIMIDFTKCIKWWLTVLISLDVSIKSSVFEVLNVKCLNLCVL